MTKGIRLLAWITAVLLAVALVLFAYSGQTGNQALKQSIASKADQISTLRDQRDKANNRADTANTRADSVTRIALAGIQTIACAQAHLLEVTSAFARLVYLSPNSTADQKATVAPFVAIPPAPRGCPKETR